MFKAFFSKMSKKDTKKADKSSEFSKFFREASSGEKKKVFLEVARNAAKEQLEVIRSVQTAR
jgi:hypothetical protein